jgi:hypothetical protein
LPSCGKQPTGMQDDLFAMYYDLDIHYQIIITQLITPDIERVSD